MDHNLENRDDWWRMRLGVRRHIIVLQGSVLATAPSTTFGDGEVWMLYGFGDATNGYELRPVKLTRN